MPIITRLAQGVKNPNRVNLYLDGQFAFALSIDEVARHSLGKGQELSSEQMNNLIEADHDAKVYAKILNFLSYRPRTIKEVHDRLWKYEIKDNAKQNLLIDRLKSNGYLDDLAFAKWFINSRNNSRPRSPRMLTQELKSKGVSTDTIGLVINDMADESSVITRILEKKLGSRRALSHEERHKIYTYLSRQGFSWETLKEVVKTWESE